MTVEVGAELLVSLTDKVGAIHDRVMKHPKEVVYQTPLAFQFTANGTNIELDLYPTRGNCWSIRRLTVFGFTAGTVNVYFDAIEPVAPFPVPAVNTYGRGELLLMPGQRLTANVAGLAGTGLLFGVADEFPHWYLSEYLD